MVKTMRKKKGSGDAVRHFRFLFLTSWQAAVLPAYIIPTTSKHRREISSGKKKDVGKPVGAVSAEWLSEVCCVFYSRLTDGMMCPACGEFLNNGCGTA